MIWPFSDAQAQIEDVLDQAFIDGPQYIVYGEKTYVLVTEDEYLERIAEGPGSSDVLHEGPRVQHHGVTGASDAKVGN